jgi:predicted transcriptional regulator
MAHEEVYGELEKEFGLRKNHLLILKALESEALTADQLCDKTKIPKGRIYDFLNTLIERKLISKREGAPAVYEMKDLRKAVSDFLEHSFDDFVKRETRLLERLGGGAGQESISILANMDDFNLSFARAIRENDSMTCVMSCPSVPYVFYPTEEWFNLLRPTVTSKRKTATGLGESALLLYRTVRETWEKKKKLNYVTTGEAIALHFKLCREILGREKLDQYVRKIEEHLKRFPNINVWVAEENPLLHVWGAGNMTTIILKEIGGPIGILINSEKGQTFRNAVLKQMIEKSVPIRKLSLKKYLPNGSRG